MKALKKYRDLKYSTFIVIIGVLLGLSGCAVTDVDRTADFTSYKTFGWGESEILVRNPVYRSDLINKNIKSTVASEFAKRGVVAATNSTPDLLVSYRTYTEQKQQYGNNNYGYPYYGNPFIWGWGWAPFGYGYWGNQRQYNYTEGTLVLDIKDTKRNEVIWRGSVNGNVNDVSRLQKQIAKGIKAIMKKYPVTPEEYQEKLVIPDHKAVI